MIEYYYMYIFGQENPQNITPYYTVEFRIFNVKCSEIITPLLGSLTNNMCGHFARCFYPFENKSGEEKHDAFGKISACIT